MTPAEIALAVQAVEWLAGSIPKWIADSRAKGEMTAEQEAGFQARLADVFSKDYAQPDKPPAAA